MEFTTEHRRRSIRLRGHDYSSPGAYFITVCTHSRECVLSKIKDNRVLLTNIGFEVDKYWQLIPGHFACIQLDEFCIMPNHIHGILIVRPDSIYDSNCEGVRYEIKGNLVEPLQDRITNRFQHIIPRSIGSIIRTYKTAVTKRCRNNGYRVLLGNAIIMNTSFEVKTNLDAFANISATILENGKQTRKIRSIVRRRTDVRAMFMEKTGSIMPGSEPLRLIERPLPEIGARDLLLRVSVCGVCHTELDEIEGRTPPPRLPVVPGHQVVGRVERCGPEVSRFRPGDRVGAAWIFSACGECEFCRRGDENLCSAFCATGRDADGGYAEFMVVNEAFAVALPDAFSDESAAPLLCTGAVGWRSLRLTGLQDGQCLGFFGFGASAHLVLQLARCRFPSGRCFVFTRSEGERQFALQLGAEWAGDIRDEPPRHLHAAIDTTPAWGPVLAALERLRPGGRLVINAIRKENTDRDRLLELDYSRHLWLEKEIKSVANVSSRDVTEFLELAAAVPLKPEVELYPLEEANRALLELKERKIRGAKVLKIT
jgi:alcohol dehydrogenase, propanol-preferring